LPENDDGFQKTVRLIHPYEERMAHFGFETILAEDGEIDMHCDYCGTRYLFDARDIAAIRNNASPADPQIH